jgi:hypothetical protein
MEAQYAQRRSTLPAHLFMSVGALEDNREDSLAGMKRFASQMERREYKRLTLEKRVFPGEDHCTVISPSFQAGLKMALKIKN